MTKIYFQSVWICLSRVVFVTPWLIGRLVTIGPWANNWSPQIQTFCTKCSHVGVRQCVFACTLDNFFSFLQKWSQSRLWEMRMAFSFQCQTLKIALSFFCIKLKQVDCLQWLGGLSILQSPSVNMLQGVFSHPAQLLQGVNTQRGPIFSFNTPPINCRQVLGHR